jgi:hypothetical protein
MYMDNKILNVAKNNLSAQEQAVAGNGPAFLPPFHTSQLGTDVTR